MRLTCPLCGARDRREFTYYGAAVYADRPAPDAGPEAWDAYLHLRDNPAGETRDLWYHEYGCAAWIEVTRDTVTHEIRHTRLLADRARTARKRGAGA
ncbi:sarcosine oxidase subunit delta [Albidovulum sp.]